MTSPVPPDRFDVHMEAIRQRFDEILAMIAHMNDLLERREVERADRRAE